MVPSDSLPSPPAVQVGDFEGPLDLLLDEVRRQNVAIEDVRLAPITSRFLEYVRTARQRSLNLNIEWLQMAATLIHWKSQSLLPPEPGLPATDSMPDELLQQLLAHRRKIAEELATRRAIVEASFSRSAGVRETDAEAEDHCTRQTTVWDMIRQAREIAAWVEQHRQKDLPANPIFEVEPDEVSIAEMMVYLREQLAAAGSQIDGLRLLNQQTSVARRSSLFLAMLEMARNRQVDIGQAGAFAPISLTPIGLSKTNQVNQ